MKKINTILTFSAFIAIQATFAMQQPSNQCDEGHYKNDYRLDEGYTPLTCAAEDGDEPTCEQLITAGADVNAKNSNGLTPLSYAAGHGHKDVVQLLLKNGANIHTNDRNQSALFRACFTGQYEICSLLLNRGADVNFCDKDGFTPLIIAAGLPSPKSIICQLLLLHGAKTTSKTVHGGTALLSAALMGNEKVCKILVSHQKKLEDSMFSLLTCLKHASSYDACAKFLYRHRDVLLVPHLKCYTMKTLLNAQDKKGNSAYSLSTPIRELNGQKPLEFLKPM